MGWVQITDSRRRYELLAAAVGRVFAARAAEQMAEYLPDGPRTADQRL